MDVSFVRWASRPRARSYAGLGPWGDSTGYWPIVIIGALNDASPRTASAQAQ
jgi:hypothetical protein